MTPELLFGSPQVWAPAIGYSQPSMASASRFLNPLTPPNVIQASQSFTPVGPAAPVPHIASLPPMGEPPGGVTASALLAAVAVRRGQPLGPTSDQEVEDFISDALDLLPGSGDIDVRCEGGRATLTGQVSHKRLKRDAGEIAWAIPSVNDVQNNVTIVQRRRSRPAREGEQPPPAGRKQP